MVQYQSRGTSAIAALVRSLFALSPSKDSQGSGQVRAGTSLMLDHINLGLVILALVKSVEHSLLLKAVASNPEAAQAPACPQPNQQKPWSGNVEVLVMCLLSLEKTVVGSFPARDALNSLLRQHGDTVMECWSLECEREPQPQPTMGVFTPLGQLD